MAKILRFRKDREQAKGQKALFEAADVAPTADLVLRSPGTTDATPHGPGASDASALGAGDRLGDAVVVDRAFVEQPGHGRIDGLGVVVAAGEALPDLRLGQLAPSEHFERVDVSPAGVHEGH